MSLLNISRSEFKTNFYNTNKQNKQKQITPAAKKTTPVSFKASIEVSPYVEKLFAERGLHETKKAVESLREYAKRFFYKKAVIRFEQPTFQDIQNSLDVYENRVTPDFTVANVKPHGIDIRHPWVADCARKAEDVMMDLLEMIEIRFKHLTKVDILKRKNIYEFIGKKQEYMVGYNRWLEDYRVYYEKEEHRFTRKWDSIPKHLQDIPKPSLTYFPPRRLQRFYVDFYGCLPDTRTGPGLPEYSKVEKELLWIERQANIQVYVKGAELALPFVRDYDIKYILTKIDVKNPKEIQRQAELFEYFHVLDNELTGETVETIEKGVPKISTGY